MIKRLHQGSENQYCWQLRIHQWFWTLQTCFIGSFWVTLEFVFSVALGKLALASDRSTSRTCLQQALLWGYSRGFPGCLLVLDSWHNYRKVSKRNLWVIFCTLAVTMMSTYRVFPFDSLWKLAGLFLTWMIKTTRCHEATENFAANTSSPFFPIRQRLVWMSRHSSIWVKGQKLSFFSPNSAKLASELPLEVTALIIRVPQSSGHYTY